MEPAQSKAGRNSQTQMWSEDEDGGNLTKVSGWDPVTVNVLTDQEVPWWEDARNSSTSLEGQPWLEPERRYPRMKDNADGPARSGIVVKTHQNFGEWRSTFGS